MKRERERERDEERERERGRERERKREKECVCVCVCVCRRIYSHWKHGHTVLYRVAFTRNESCRDIALVRITQGASSIPLSLCMTQGPLSTEVSIQSACRVSRPHSPPPLSLPSPSSP